MDAEVKPIKPIIAPVRQQLKDLYTVGKEVEFSDTAKVWIQKITPVQDREAVKRSYTPRAKTLALIKEKTEEDRLTFIDTLASWGLREKEDFVNFLAAPEIRKLEASTEAKIGAEKEWADNDYLISLQEAWNDELEERYIKDNDDEDALRVWNELQRFSNQVENIVEFEKKDIIDDLMDRDEDYLLSKVTEVLLEHQAGQDQIIEYHFWQIYFATRFVDDHDKLFFDSREDVDSYPAEIFERLLNEYINMTMDGISGKD